MNKQPLSLPIFFIKVFSFTIHAHHGSAWGPACLTFPNTGSGSMAQPPSQNTLVAIAKGERARKGAGLTVNCSGKEVTQGPFLLRGCW